MSVLVNDTLRDLLGSALGCVLFVPLLLAPGYVAGWFCGVFRFRSLTAPWKLLLSLPLSVAICPIVTYWAGSGGWWLPVYILYGACFAVWLSLLAGFQGHDVLPRWLSGFRAVPRIGWAVPAMWFAIAIGSLVNVQYHNRLYLSFTDYDHQTRAAITDAITRGGVRPFNPFYFLGNFSRLRYHYFWFLPCSLVTQMGGPLVRSQQAIIASVVWCGWALIALVPLCLRFFFERTGAALRRRSIIGIGLFAVTGLDLIPTGIIFLRANRLFPDMEWWNEQVTSWFGAVLWVPHHVGGLVACMAGFLLAWDASHAESRPQRAAGIVLAGAAFATAAGTSIYVTLVFAIFLVQWTSITLLKRWWNQTVVLVAAGAVSAALVMPYLLSLTGPGSGRLICAIRRAAVLSPESGIGRCCAARPAAPGHSAACAAAELLPGTGVLRRGCDRVSARAAKTTRAGAAKRTGGHYPRSGLRGGLHFSEIRSYRG